MPDPALLLLAFAAAAIVSAVVCAGGAQAPGGWRGASPRRAQMACVLGVGLGLVIGYQVLGIGPAWPPTSALGRWLLIVFPIVIGIELAASAAPTAWRSMWALRLGLAAVLARILLHDSVYVAGPRPQWTAWQTLLVCAIGGVLLSAEWALLLRLARRAAGSVLLAIAMAGLCGAIAVMVGGYVTGGEAAFPLAAALVGCAAASMRTGDAAVQGAIGIGLVGLFSLLFVGRFFGGISTSTALVVLLAPLLGYATELRTCRELRPWRVGALRLVLVALPLAAVLFAAKRDFDQKLRPLMPMREMREHNGGTVFVLKGEHERPFQGRRCASLQFTQGSALG